MYPKYISCGKIMRDSLSPFFSKINLNRHLLLWIGYLDKIFLFVDPFCDGWPRSTSQTYFHSEDNCLLLLPCL